MAQVITKITTQKRKGRYNIFINDKYAFPVSENTLIQFQLAKGLELSDEDIEHIQAGEVVAQANSLALNYLSFQPRTVAELRKHLLEGEIPESVIPQVIQRLTELNYLDDAQYARQYIEERLRLGDKGPTVLRQKLRQKGIRDDLVQAALDEVDPNAWIELGQTVAEKLQTKQHHRAHHDAVRRVQQGLMQKGFSSDDIAKIMADLPWEDTAGEEQEELVRQAEKQWRQKRQYQGYERRQKVKQALYRKGFDLDAIDQVLTRLEQE